ncbi:MAG TPA: DinB family protein [Acidimicrobiales bacterium]|jgi:hypothetical protein
MTPVADDERTALLDTLAYQRASVLGIVDGLSEENWHRSIVPSGWTISGFIEHLAGAERRWFHQVVANDAREEPWYVGRPDYDFNAPFTCDRPSRDVLAYYLDICRRSDAYLAAAAMSDAPKGLGDEPDLLAEVPSVRWVVLHMIEETASHSGHLEIARELLDGATKRGLR